MKNDDEVTLYLKVRGNPEDVDALQDLLASGGGRDHLANWLGWMLEQAVALARVPWVSKNWQYDVTLTDAARMRSNGDG